MRRLSALAAAALAALMILTTVALSGAAAAAEPPRLRFSDRGEAVSTLQRALGLPESGYFNEATYRAVKALQQRLGLRVSGVADARTWQALGPRASRNAARHAAAAASTTPQAGADGRVCPVRRPIFGDGWGAPRWHGSHKGVDLMGKRGAAIFAVDSGVVTRAERQGNGSLAVDITGSRGMWFYGHFDTIGVRTGQRISAGQVIGTMGDSGSPGAVHLHIEWHPGGNWAGAVDPAPLLRALC